ncbi:MAG: cytochrome c [Gammaproteobacteria bacterium]|nr:cytochrome c [Gammaproteobacteria bacterium]
MTKALAISTLAVVCGMLYWLFATPGVADVDVPNGSESIDRGRYLVDAGGCVSCHAGTEHPESLSGGLALEHEFGTFYVSNITPDAATGIGNWKAEDFLRALKHGRSPGGGFYYPAFPYPSYGGLTDQDVLDIAAYLMSLPAVEFRIPQAEVPFWLPRWTIAFWNRLANLSSSALPEETDARIARGAYLAHTLGHCGECHTPRNAVGIPDFEREFAGATLGESEADAIDAAALQKWTQEDFAFFLMLGAKPDGEFVGGEMEQVIEHNTSKLTLADRQALAAFFKR